MIFVLVANHHTNSKLQTKKVTKLAIRLTKADENEQ